MEKPRNILARIAEEQISSSNIIRSVELLSNLCGGFKHLLSISKLFIKDVGTAYR
ncbi:MAG: hypothetical protein QW162_08625 [Ignisphaera sp.]